MSHALLGGHSLSLLADEGLVDVGDDSTSGNGGLDQGVQLLVSSDGELQMARGDSLHLQVLGGVASQLQHLGGEVLQDGRAVHGGGGANTTSSEAPALEVTMDPSDRKLETCSGRSRDSLLL